ncbi:hypothetical protein FN846DRAFT_910181 [Sphaerosporella brunnea]|uniref:Uncharacterized protein n=1 Tax=Sphaerosporella brunnea TaxID=1250544 RepID=A0A5J5ENX5_9PEZI|nr:hypothetical protein FN846DRAFT_910181 [Sphaerosporella brunnea]
MSDTEQQAAAHATLVSTLRSSSASLRNANTQLRQLQASLLAAPAEQRDDGQIAYVKNCLRRIETVYDLIDSIRDDNLLPHVDKRRLEMLNRMVSGEVSVRRGELVALLRMVEEE